MLRNLDELAVPIDPVGFEVGDITATKTEPATEQKDEPRLNPSRFGEVPTRLQKRLELPSFNTSSWE